MPISDVVCIPRLDRIRYSCSNGFGKGGEGKSVKNHRQGIALGNAFAREKDGTVAALAAKDELGGVSIAIKAKLGAVCPSVADGP